MKPFLIFALSFSASLPAQAPTAVPITKEPHHHLVLENDYVRVFRVSVPAHGATLLHQHDVPYLYISLGPADVINAVQDKPEARIVMTDGQLGYSPGHFAHIARNESDMDFNNVTIELLHPQGEPHNFCAQIVSGVPSVGCDKTTGSAAGGGGFSIEPQLETEEIALDLVRLKPETKSPKVTAPARSLLVALNGSEVQVDVAGKSPKTLRGGEVVWIGSGLQGFVSNPGKKPSNCLELSIKDKGYSAKP